MKLSEMMLLGSMVRGQSYHSFCEHRLDGQVTSCAMGAALEAIGVPITEMSREEIVEDAIRRGVRAWSWMLNPERCPHGKCRKKCRVDNLIYHINNRHKWTRERIAAFIASIEPHEPATTAEKVGEVEHEHCL